MTIRSALFSVSILVASFGAAAFVALSSEAVRVESAAGPIGVELTHSVGDSFSPVPSGPSIGPGEATYPGGEIALLAGDGFDAGDSLDVVVTRPDGSVVTGDDPDTAGWDTIVSDDEGGFLHAYQTPSDLLGQYDVAVYRSVDSGHSVVLASTAFTTEEPPPAIEVMTDAGHYAPTETATIDGSGFSVFPSIDIVVLRPDGSVVTGDGTGTPGWDSAVPNAEGSFTYQYQLASSGSGVWAVYIYDSSDAAHSTALAQTDFTSGPKVTTDKEDYAPDEIVTVTGVAFDALVPYDVVITRPDGSIITGDGSWAEGWDTVAADGVGEFVYTYQLNGIEGPYFIDVFDSPWGGPESGEAPVAIWAFTDHSGGGLHGGFCGGFTSESNLAWDTDCRQTFVYDPGIGELQSRSQLLSKASFWRSTGGASGWERPRFSNNFLWYSSVRNITFKTGDSRNWASCNRTPYSLNWAKPYGGPTHIGNVCPGSYSLPAGPVREDFTQNVALSAFEFGGDYIIRACGNFNTGPKAKPIPKVTGRIWWDKDRDGVKDASEPWLSGWTANIKRKNSKVGQGSGIVGSDGTDSSGRYVFALNGHGPAQYRGELVLKSGWKASTPTVTGYRTINYASRSNTYGFNLNFGVYRESDVAKTSEIISAPATFKVSEDASVVVRSILTNIGPFGPINIRDTITPAVPADCDATPPGPVTVDRTLAAGASATVDVSFTIHCRGPSLHTFVFDDCLSILTADVYDPNTGNDCASASTLPIPVFADADLEVTSATVGCPDVVYVGVVFQCTVDATVHNNGPYGPVNADASVGISGPPDCTLNPTGLQEAQDISLQASVSEVVTRTWDVTCSAHSSHVFEAVATLAPDELHVEDTDPGNNDGGGSDTVAVFRDVDVSVETVEVDCPDEAEVGTAFLCTVDATLLSGGPISSVGADATVDLSLPFDCSQVPAGPVKQGVSLPAGTSVIVSTSWSVICTDYSFHTAVGSAEVEVSELHINDPNGGNDASNGQDTTAVLAPTDVKVSALAVTAPASVNPGDSFTVSIDVTVHNNGPLSPMDSEGGVGLAVPADCRPPDPDVTYQLFNPLSTPVSTSVVVTRSWTVTCTEPGAHELIACGRVGPRDLHVFDTNPYNNHRSETFSVDVGSGPKIVYTGTRCSIEGDPDEVCGNGIDDDLDGLIDEGPDTDGDGVNDCQDSDDDGDGFSDAAEEYVGTNPLAPCPRSSIDNAWPPDFDNSAAVNISDVLALKPSFGSTFGSPAYHVRFDLDGSRAINISDVLALKPIFGVTCTP